MKKEERIWTGDRGGGEERRGEERERQERSDTVRVREK